MKHTFEDWSFGGHRTMESWLEEMAGAPYVQVKLSFYREPVNPKWYCSVTIYPRLGEKNTIAHGQGAHPYDAVLVCARDYWEHGNKEAA